MTYDDLNNDELREKPSIEETLAAVKSADGLDATIFYGLSDLADEEVDKFQDVFETLEDDRRRWLMRQLVEIGEANFEFDYTGAARVGLNDPDAVVREAAVEAMWEDESTELLIRLLDIAQWDDARDVRAAATQAIGRFILLGELGEFPESDALKAQDVVIGILNNEDEEIEVRRRALEAIANSSNDIVEGAIRDAYESHERPMRISSIFAMGRSCDEQWNEIVMHELDSADTEIRYEAARAAGELMLTEAIPALSRMAFESDRELQDNAIWSLGEIGGKEALRVLNLLAGDAREADDEDLLEAVEDAIASAALGGDDLLLMEFDDVDED
ncbi:MAG: HEAT repeat domain-containing protein [Anaerolineae bacterium]